MYTFSVFNFHRGSAAFASFGQASAVRAAIIGQGFTCSDITFQEVSA